VTSSSDPRSTKDRLLDAAERLFARDGVQGARIRDINELAGQRNPSALHYHFGTRMAVVEAILLRYQSAIDVTVAEALAHIEDDGREPDVREVVSAVVPAEVEALDTQSGRDCVRIIPQLLPALSRNLRTGVVSPATVQSRRIFALLDDRMAGLGLPEHVRRERLVTYALVFTTMLGERAHAIEQDPDLLLTRDEFTDHMVDVLEAILVAPSSLSPDP
jgi:AcrR family transcriptional regulator